MKNLYVLVLLLCHAAVFSKSHAVVISSIDELDKASLFHYSIMSDRGADSQTDPLADPENKKGLAWVRSSAFVSGGGHTVELGTSSYKTGVYYVEGFAGRNRIIKKLALVR